MWQPAAIRVPHRNWGFGKLDSSDNPAKSPGIWPFLALSAEQAANNIRLSVRQANRIVNYMALPREE